jgi:hypothetical protein
MSTLVQLPIRPFFRLFLLSLTVAAVTGCASSTGTTSQESSEENGIKPFDDVITADAVTDEGLFNVHQLDDEVYFEIADSLLDVEILLVTRLAATADNILFGGWKTNTQVVRWQRHSDNILLRVVSYENVADKDQPIYQAVRNSNFEPIVRVFKIEAYNRDTTGVVVKVTGLFTEDVPLIGLPKSMRETYKVSKLDGTRSFVTSAKSYPQNVEVRHVLTYAASEPPSGASTNTISLEMNQSMILLPADPMMPRLCDRRVGFINLRLTDYGRDAQKAEERCYVTRWRLEPSDPEAYARGELVEPVKPIVYYIDPATPEKWRPYIKQGVDDWKVAFEEAGFRNAIMAKDPPTPEEDPEFSPEDVRYSVIRYFASPIENAFGPHVHDPRTGEILESDIGWFHNVMNLLRNWFFVQTAAINPDARGVEFEDEVMGRLIRFVSAHEVGHTLGFPHNWGSSSAYPVDSLRSPAYTDAHGTAPSIMDYARFNFVAQPGDGVTNLMPDIGIYDKWSVKWGYTYLPEADSPDETQQILNNWVVERADDPMYFYGRQGGQIDPRSQREDLGDDAVKASDYGISNLKVILGNLVEWTAETGKDYDDLEELYGQVGVQWNRYVGHVGRNVGGWYQTFKTFDQEGPVYELVPEEKQREAMAWLNREVWTTPDWLVDQDVLRRFEGVGSIERLRGYQVGSVNLLLDHYRISRMIEADVMTNGDTYTATQMLEDVRAGIWSELSDGSAIGPYRRNLQRGHVERLEYLLTEEALVQAIGFESIAESQSDVRALARGELEAIRTAATSATSLSGDGMTDLHLKDVVARINKMLDDD